MRDRISAELDIQRPPLGALVGQAVAEGRRKKRRARLGVYTMSTVGVLVVAGAAVQLAPSASSAAQRGGAAAGYPGSRPTGGTPAPAPSPAESKPAPTSTVTSTAAAATTDPVDITPLTVSPIVKQVDPGTSTLEKGIYLRYAADSMSWWEYEGGLTTRYNGTNTWGSDFVATSGTDRLLSGFYVGDKDVAAAAVTIDGKQYPAVVVKVNGSHGWCGLYYLRPPGPPGMESVLVDVYDSGGKVIAATGVGEVEPPHTPGGSGVRTLPVTSVPINTPFPGATVMVPPGANADGSEPGKH